MLRLLLIAISVSGCIRASDFLKSQIATNDKFQQKFQYEDRLMPRGNLYYAEKNKNNTKEENDYLLSKSIENYKEKDSHMKQNAHLSSKEMMRSIKHYNGIVYKKNKSGKLEIDEEKSKFFLQHYGKISDAFYGESNRMDMTPVVPYYNIIEIIKFSNNDFNSTENYIDVYYNTKTEQRQKKIVELQKYKVRTSKDLNLLAEDRTFKNY